MTERLPSTNAYLTWTKGGNEIEDRIKAAWRNASNTQGESAALKTDVALDQIQQNLNASSVSFEEWGVLLRVVLLTQRRASRRPQVLKQTWQ
ncbi:MAG TPA: hypothetical protein VKZ50_05860 [bacterium]|nr:hypothetical protein [bacterium]